MSRGLYFEICMLCMFIIFVLIGNLKRQYILLLEDKLFRNVMWTAAGLFICDGIWSLIEGMHFDGARELSCLCNIMYFILSGLIGELWLIYTDYRIHQDEIRLRRKAILFSIPFLVLVILTLASAWTGWIFRLNPENHYLRGRYHFVQMIIAYGYLVWASVEAIRKSRDTEKKYLKEEYRTLATFTILPVTGGIFQGILFGYPLVWAGTVISILIVFINLQNQQISKDGLTGVYNRRYLNRYLDARICNKHRRKKIYFILMDIDGFKDINDTYGHIEGDVAIIRITGILKEICCTNNDFLARYGGDEFAIVCEREDNQEVENLIREIDEIIDFFNKAGELEYKMQLSIGYAKLGEQSSNNQDQLIALADKRLYDRKRERKMCMTAQ